MHFQLKIDPDNNGDVDVDEWVNGLKDLGVNLSETEMRLIFEILDKEGTEYVDKNDFVNFLTVSYTNAENQRYQREIMTCIQTLRRKHSSTHSNLLQATESKIWDNMEVISLQQEMQEHMNSLVRELSPKVEVENKFVEEFEKKRKRKSR